jgi:biopolymer transport protein ExbD
MNFQRGRRREEPEINLVPMIDVLLVILIFLMITTTYSRYSELEINLPRAVSPEPVKRSEAIDIGISASGKYTINGMPAEYNGAGQLQDAMHKAANGQSDPVIVINADGAATHQSVVTVMEAARLAGYNHITFTTQHPR